MIRYRHLYSYVDNAYNRSQICQSHLLEPWYGYLTCWCKIPTCAYIWCGAKRWLTVSVALVAHFALLFSLAFVAFGPLGKPGLSQIRICTKFVQVFLQPEPGWLLFSEPTWTPWENEMLMVFYIDPWCHACLELAQGRAAFTSWTNKCPGCQMIKCELLAGHGSVKSSKTMRWGHVTNSKHVEAPW